LIARQPPLVCVGPQRIDRFPYLRVCG
jgi:hypothetical protein